VSTTAVATRRLRRRLTGLAVGVVALVLLTVAVTLVALVAESVDDVNDAVPALSGALLIAFPIALAVLGGLTWWLVGRALGPVDEAAARQARFVSDASHELRSPLARIQARLEVDLAHPDGADPFATGAAVLADARTMQRLVDDLLALAAADEGSPRARVPVDLDDVVLAEAALRRVDGGIDVDTSGVSGARVEGDPADLARVVGNVLDNAVRHADRLVRVGLGERGQAAVLTIDDDGPGIPPGRRAQVFERFARIDDARTPGSGGTGLGLAIARDLTERNGGTIAVGDALLGGARFVITFPVA
jgi:signal transduction histidine kinase